MVDNRILKLDKDQVIEFFKELNFRDEYGHPLINCTDFLDLVDEAKGSTNDEVEQDGTFSLDTDIEVSFD